MNETRQALSQSMEQVKSRPRIAVIALISGLVVLVFAMAVSVSVGADPVPISTVWQALFHFQSHVTNQQVIRAIRMPRAVAGAFVGAGFAVAGALMQGMTRNPLADPGLLAINGGSELLLALSFALTPKLPFSGLLVCSFVGAGVGAALVYGIGSLSRGGLTPIRLALSGAAISALLVALSQGIALYFGLSQDLTYWLAGGLSGVTWNQVDWMMPVVAIGLLGSVGLSRQITLLSLGEDVAVSLGQRVMRTRLFGVLWVVLLAGSAVAIGGPIAFVGLVVPHMTRSLVGADYRWIIPGSAIFGALLMVIADVAARMINPPYETPIGALIALIGVPFFLYLARQDRGIH